MVWLLVASGFVIVLAWVTVWFPGWPWWVAAIVTAVVVLVVIGVFVFRRIRAARRAAALERELLRQADEQADHVRPDRRLQVQELQARMREALRELKSSKLGGAGGRAALYALPWYVIVGPPAAGKTTALQQSELSFVSPGGASSPRLRGTAGTKNCDWWFSKDAILLDTAGRFVTHDDDEAEWFAFLDTLKVHRGKKPLDGIVVAVSVSDLVGGERGGNVEDLAQQLRAKVDELLARLDMVLPMYVVFTKADLIGGFVEFWSDLNKQQRRQVWGATFAFDDDRLTEPSAAFEDEYLALIQTVHARMLERVPDERVGGARAGVLQFPAELEALAPVLSRFIGELCQPNPYKDTALFRGFYFTSGTQVGRPFDRVLSNMLSGFGLGERLGVDQRSAGAAVSYFVTDLFKTIIFRDRDAAVRSGSFAQARARTHIIVAGGALFAALTVVVPSLLSYVENQDLVRATERELVGADKGRLANGIPSGARLDALLVRVRALETDAERFSVSGLLGPYAAKDLLTPLHRVYTNEVRAVVEGPIRDQVTADARAVEGQARLDEAESFWTAYEDVKLYVLMTEPEHFDGGEAQETAAWAAKQLARVWAKLGGIESKPEIEQLETHARYYVDELVKDHTWAWSKDANLLQGARRRLSQQPLETLQYSFLLQRARDAAPIRPDQIFIGGSASYVTTRAPGGVPGVYTKDGWEAVKAGLSSALSSFELESWVLGTQGGGARSASVDRLRDMYFGEYVRAWRELIANLNVATPTSVEDAIAELRALNGTENGPYAVLFRTLATNARLDMSPASLKDKLVEGAKSLATAAASAAASKLGKDAGVSDKKKSPAEEKLAPLIRFGVGEAPRGSAPTAPAPLTQCLEELKTLEVKLGMLRESKSEPTQALAEELGRTSATVERLLTGLDGATRLLVEPLLMNPIRGSRAGVATTATSALGDKWKADVFAVYEAKIAPRYPFTEGPDIALSDFVEFFKPQGGTLWGFFEKNLTDRLERSGSAFSVRPSAESTQFTGDFLRCLSNAQQITDAVFGSGAEALVPMSIKLDTPGGSVGKVKLTIDGAVLTRTEGVDAWFPAQWPGKGPTRGGILRVEAPAFVDEMPRNGDFGFFRLLAAGGLKPASQTPPTYVAMFPLSRAGAPPVQVQVRPSRAVHPFGPGFFSRLRCPPIITLGSAP